MTHNELEGFPAFVKQALEQYGTVTFRIDWLGRPKLEVNGVTWAAPRNYDLGEFAAMVKSVLGVTTSDYVRGDDSVHGFFRTKSGKILIFHSTPFNRFGAGGELRVIYRMPV